MEEPTREMEKETGAETDLPETEPAAEQEEKTSSRRFFRLLTASSADLQRWKTRRKIRSQTA